MEKPGKPRKFLAATVGGLTLVLLVGVIGWMIWSAVATTVHEWNERAVKNAEAIKVAQAEMQHRAAMKVPLATITHDAPTDANAANAINAAVPAASPAPIPLATISGMAPSASKNDLPLAATSAPQTSSSPKPLSLATVGAMPLTKPNQASELATVATPVTNELTGKVPQAVVSSSVAPPDASKLGMAVVAPSLPSKASLAEAVKLASVGALPNPKELPAVATVAPLSIGNGKPNPLAAVATTAKETPASPLNIARLTPLEASKSILEPTQSPVVATDQPSVVPLATIRPAEAYSGRLDVARVGRRDPEQTVMESLGKLGKPDSDSPDVPLATVSGKDADQLWNVIPGMSEVQLVDKLGRPVPKTLDIPLATVSESDPENAMKPVPGAFVMSLCTDLQGNLWAGCEEDDQGGGGVWRKDAVTGKWTQFTAKDGLGDDNGYAVACDQQGRIWAGHLNHGVSVYNGQKWQCYEVVGGLSRSDTLSGPLGERVFAIKVCPTDGDVWIATNCGLARYSPKSDTWSYRTRADGLPSDQASSMAFDAEGNIYVGTQCDGLAIAQAKDNYKIWRQVTARGEPGRTGPDQMPTTASGEGLPTNLINDVLVTKDGTLYVATTTGLAESHDKGKTFKYWRGQDYAAKCRGASRRGVGGEIIKGVLFVDAALREDYVTCLSEGKLNSLWIGYREKGFESVDADTLIRRSVANGKSNTSITNLLPIQEDTIASTYGSSGLVWNRCVLKSVRDLQLGEPFPSGARARSLEEQCTRQTSPHDTLSVDVDSFIGQDCLTQGHWMGRYGKDFALLCGAGSPLDHLVTAKDGFAVKGEIGAGFPADGIRRWIHELKTTRQSTLYNPLVGARRQSEWDDHGEAYPRVLTGPDIIVDVRKPIGGAVVSLYFNNKDGHFGANTQRDYTVEVTDVNRNQVVARARVRDFYHGTYLKFFCSGTHYRIRVNRNHSLNAILSGIFIDRALDPNSDFVAKYRDVNRNYLPPIDDDLIAEIAMSSQSEALRSLLNRARELSLGISTGRTIDRGELIDICRGLYADNHPDTFCRFIRWHLNLWDTEDLRRLESTFNNDFRAFVVRNPRLRLNNH